MTSILQVQRPTTRPRCLQIDCLILMSLFSCRLITHSECLQELDLDDNLVGDLGGREILDALMDRKEGQGKATEMN